VRGAGPLPRLEGMFAGSLEGQGAKQWSVEGGVLGGGQAVGFMGGVPGGT
jgi:hypothetical protein